MDQLQRLRYVTRRYRQLQGLRLIPLGVPFLMSGAWQAGDFRSVWTITGHRPEDSFAILFCVALVTATALGLYYRRRFGAVQPAWRIRGLLTVVASLAAFAVTVWLQGLLHPAVSLPLLVIGVAVGYVGVRDDLIRPHYLFVAAICLVLAVLGAVGVAAHTRVVLLDAATGIGLILIGLGDHLLIRRTLQPVAHVESV